MQSSHGSGFEGFQTEGQVKIPLKVNRIVKKLNLMNIQFKPDNFVVIVYSLIAIIKHINPQLDRWFISTVCVEVLNNIPELSSLEPIFEASIDHFLTLLEKRKRSCEICNIV